MDQGVSVARATRPGFDRALESLQQGDTLVITTLDRLGRSTANMLDLAKAFRERGIGLRVLNLGGGDVDTGTPMRSMVFTVMAALARMELEIKRERITDSVSRRRAAGKDLGGPRERFTNSQIDNARRLIEACHAGCSGHGHFPSNPLPTHRRDRGTTLDHHPRPMTPTGNSFAACRMAIVKRMPGLFAHRTGQNTPMAYGPNPASPADPRIPEKPPAGRPEILKSRDKRAILFHYYSYPMILIRLHGVEQVLNK